MNSTKRKIAVVEFAAAREGTPLTLIASWGKCVGNMALLTTPFEGANLEIVTSGENIRFMENLVMEEERLNLDEIASRPKRSYDAVESDGAAHERSQCFMDTTHLILRHSSGSTEGSSIKTSLDVFEAVLRLLAFISNLLSIRMEISYISVILFLFDVNAQLQ